MGEEAPMKKTCLHWSPKRDDENELIADLLLGLTNVHNTLGVLAVFPASAEREGSSHWAPLGLARW
jgi:hypothetical protein